MIIPQIFMNFLYFVTDCDGTIAHYNCTSDGFISLPASSGSKKVAVVSPNTISLLDEIAKSNVTIICASGMRYETMLQRIPYFPAIRFWICENGGRIFESIDGEIMEVAQWKELANNDASGLNSLRELRLHLESESSVKVDSNYLTMIRISTIDYSEVIPLIPRGLKYSFNLGYLDVHMAHTGKLAAVKWLLTKLADGQQDSYMFMGDDDNDIEIASHAQAAYIVRPFSKNMAKFLFLRGIPNFEVDVQNVIDNIQYKIEDNQRNEITVAQNEGPLASDELLTLILQRIKS